MKCLTRQERTDHLGYESTRFHTTRIGLQFTTLNQSSVDVKHF